MAKRTFGSMIGDFIHTALMSKAIEATSINKPLVPVSDEAKTHRTL